jgi:hypothetical protein
MEFVRETPRAVDIEMADFTDCEDKCLREPSRFAIAGSNNLITELSIYTS